MAIHVNVDNFVRAESHRMFADIQAAAGASGGSGTTGNRRPSTSRP